MTISRFVSHLPARDAGELSNDLRDVNSTTLAPQSNAKEVSTEGRSQLQLRATPQEQAKANHLVRAWIRNKTGREGNDESKVLGESVRKQVEVKTIAPGIVNVKLKGNAAFFERVGMPGMQSPHPKRDTKSQSKETQSTPSKEKPQISDKEHGGGYDSEIEYLSVSEKYSPYLAGGRDVYRPTSMAKNELQTTLSKNQSAVAKIFSKTNKGPTAYINGGFYNSGQTAIPLPASGKYDINKLSKKYPEHTSIGASKIKGVRPGNLISPPLEYTDDYHKIQFPNGSYLTSGPLLAKQNKETGKHESAFTQEKFDSSDKWEFQKNSFKPGLLSHASDPNPRSAISMPDTEGSSTVPNRASSKTNNTRLIIGKDHGKRGTSGAGFTMVEWATVAQRLGSFNQRPGKAVNLDGGASSVIGVIDNDGRKIMESKGHAGTPTASTMIALTQAPLSILSKLASMLKGKK